MAGKLSTTYRAAIRLKIANAHCLPLANLLRFSPDVWDPDALEVRQVLSVEDRCVTDSKNRAAAD
jgi:hypothetical protein